MHDTASTKSMTSLLDQLAQSVDGERVSVERILDTFGTRAYGPILACSALLEMLPIIGAIPGLFILTGSVIILTAGQLLMFRSHPWLPKRIQRYSFSSAKLTRALMRARRWTMRIDRVARPRLTTFVNPPFVQVIAIVCVTMALLFFPFAFIPSSERLLAIPVFFFGVALTVGDGLLALIGLSLAVGLVALFIVYWPQVLRALPLI